jgi:hypothetical protein
VLCTSSVKAQSAVILVDIIRYQVSEVQSTVIFAVIGVAIFAVVGVVIFAVVGVVTNNICWRHWIVGDNTNNGGQ